MILAFPIWESEHLLILSVLLIITLSFYAFHSVRVADHLRGTEGSLLALNYVQFIDPCGGLWGSKLV